MKLNRTEIRMSVLLSIIVAVFILADVLSRLWPSSVTAEQRNVQTVSEFNSVGYTTTVEQLSALFNKLDPPEPEQPEDSANKPPAKPKGPTKEEQLQKLVDGGAKRLGKDVVYLRGVLISDAQYAFLNIVDENIKEQAVTLKQGDAIGDYRVAEITQNSVTLKTESGEQVTLQLFEFN